LISGSDDSLLKVWDLRTLGSLDHSLMIINCIGLACRPVGICYGHFAGVTHVDSRNDGIYICSNSKD